MLPEFYLATALPIIKGGKLILALIAGILLFRTKKTNAPKIDQPEVTTSERGSRTTYLIGRDEIAPVLTALGDEFIRKVPVNSGGKGSPSQTQDIFYQPGIHVLTASRKPRRLRKIRQNGETIWEGDLTPETSPSGTRIDLGDEGIFEIQWGGVNDAADDFATDLVGIASRFDPLVRINWIEKRLGQVLSWPTLLYEVEVTPEDVTGVLASVDPWVLKDDFEDGLISFDIAAIASLGGSGFIALINQQDLGDSSLANAFQPGQSILVNGLSSYADGTSFTIASVFDSSAGGMDFDILFPSLWVNNPCGPGTISQSKLSSLKVTVISVLEAIPQANWEATPASCVVVSAGFGPPIGQVVSAVESSESGANMGHAISQMLFAPKPLGLGIDTARWDLASLLRLAERARDEQYLTTVRLSNDSTVADAINDCGKDFGFFVVQNPDTGLLEFRLLRPDLVEVKTLPANALQGDPLEAGQNVSPNRPTTAVWAFNDRDNCYRDRTIELGDDGVARYGAVTGDTENRVTTTRDLDSATAAALRQEGASFVDLTDISAKVGFDGRRFGPGDFVQFPGELDPRLILRTLLNSDGEAGATHEATSSGYASQVSGLALALEPLTGADPTQLSIGQYRLWIMPAALQSTAQTYEAALLWTRGTGNEFQAILSLSLDDTTYAQFAAESNVVTGGVLQEDLAAGSLTGNELFTISGVDIGTVQNLEGTTSAVQQQQLLVIGDEVASVASVTLLSTDEARLGTLVRGLYSTTDTTHPAGTPFYIVQSSSWLPIADPAFFQLGQQLLYKAQPLGSGTPPSIVTILPQVVTPS